MARRFRKNVKNGQKITYLYGNGHKKWTAGYMDSKF